MVSPYYEHPGFIDAAAAVAEGSPGRALRAKLWSTTTDEPKKKSVSAPMPNARVTTNVSAAALPAASGLIYDFEDGTLEQLMLKYGSTLGEVLGHRDRLQKERRELESVEDRLEIAHRGVGQVLQVNAKPEGTPQWLSWSFSLRENQFHEGDGAKWEDPAS